ncbi:MAG: hypothetical protein OEN23_09660 [Paracoccaceae bacterium]|nr:hypothetical protein [Paracoccaceae bacterium]
MTHPSAPADLNQRWVELVIKLRQIEQAMSASGDAKVARMGSVVDAIIDFLKPIELAQGQEALLIPLYDVYQELIERRTTEADAATRKVTGGRPRVDVWTSAVRAVAIAAVDLLERHGTTRLEARKIVASQLRAAGYRPVPNHNVVKQWEHDWLPRQAQPKQFVEGHLPPEIVRHAALQQMEQRVSNGAAPTDVSGDMLKQWCAG